MNTVEGAVTVGAFEPLPAPVPDPVPDPLPLLLPPEIPESVLSQEKMKIQKVKMNKL
jgi:hypothetical protein